MNKICTSIEQSKKLMELGIDINSADMWWAERYEGRVAENGQYIVAEEPYYYSSLIKPSDINYSQDTIKDIPAWSLTALFEILPNNEVTSTTVTRGGWNIEPPKYLDIWFAEYETENHDNDFSLSAGNPVDAAFEMIVKLKEQNLI